MSSLSAIELDSVHQWHFAIGGIQTTAVSLKLASAIELRRLQCYPDGEQLAAALNSPYVAGIMHHYGPDAIGHQLVIQAASFNDFAYICDAAKAILAGLRIRTRAELFCPAVCSHPWDELENVVGKSCVACRFEPHIYSHDAGQPAMIEADDLHWVKHNLATVLKLNADARFATAIDALCSYLHTERDRMKAAQLWAGIEAIFEVQFEISFRLPLLAALMLEKRGPACRELRQQVHKLYQERSKAVHGQEFKNSKQHVHEVRKLLAALLLKIIQNGKMPTKQDFDDLVLMPDSEPG